MVEKTYRVVFMSLLTDIEEFKVGMNSLGIQATKVEEMLRKAPVVVKAGMSLGKARKVAEAIQMAGGRVNIQNDGSVEVPSRTHSPPGVKPFDSFTMCPECGHKQPRRDSCVRCGRVFCGPAEAREERSDRYC